MKFDAFMQINKNQLTMNDLLVKFPNFLKDCSEILKIYREHQNFCYRATDANINSIEKIYSRNDRKPRDTPLYVHNLFDDAFKKYYGWKVRSEGVYTYSGNNWALNAFGSKIYLVFPKNGFEYIYNTLFNNQGDLIYRLYKQYLSNYDLIDKKIFDLLSQQDINNVIKELKNTFNIKNAKIHDTFKEILFKYVKTNYTDKNLNSNLNKISHSKEVIFKCEYYYLVDTKYKEVILGD